jgi:peptidoglycan/xylan/chitin deacetylase (PgdA/CDA1 family)
MSLRSSIALAAALALLAVPAVAAGGGPPAAITHPDGADVPAGDPLDLSGATLTQAGDRLTLAVTTARPWSSSRLAAHRGRSLCAYLDAERLCVHGPTGGGRARVRLARVAPDGALTGDRSVAATVARPDQRSLTITLRLSTLGLGAGTVQWRVVAAWRGGVACHARGACVDAAPDQGTFADPLRSPVPDGCVAFGPTFQRFGPPRREVALTFDDGPDQSTAAMLSALERAHASATFFLIGRQIAGRQALVRRELADGDAVGDHTFNHPDLTRHPDLAATEIGDAATAIRDATGGFRTCLFRAPFGAVDDALFNLVRAMGMTTIGWNVDPRDWAAPGTDEIVARVLGAVTPGAIVIMHDGGGPRPQTVAAVPRIVAALRARGYRLVTVPQLLGFAATYG